MKVLGRFWRDQTGVTAIEYGLIASLIAIIVIASLHNVGVRLSTTFSSVASSL